MFSYNNISHHTKRIHRMPLKEYAEAHAVFGPDSEQANGFFVDAVVAFKSDVNGHHKSNGTPVTLSSRPISPLFNGYSLDPSLGSSGHFAHSSILFQPPPHPNLPIARKSRAFPLHEESANSNSSDSILPPVCQSFASSASDASQPGAAQHLLNYPVTTTTTNSFLETSTPSAALAAWYDGNTFSCLECGYASGSLGSYEMHVRSQHGVEPADFSAFTRMGSTMYRCECCMQQLYHEESTIRNHVHS